jgi:hypothetical protein
MRDERVRCLRGGSPAVAPTVPRGEDVRTGLCCRAHRRPSGEPEGVRSSRRRPVWLGQSPGKRNRTLRVTDARYSADRFARDQTRGSSSRVLTAAKEQPLIYFLRGWQSRTATPPCPAGRHMLFPRPVKQQKPTGVQPVGVARVSCLLRSLWSWASRAHLPIDDCPAQLTMALK